MLEGSVSLKALLVKELLSTFTAGVQWGWCVGVLVCNVLQQTSPVSVLLLAKVARVKLGWLVRVLANRVFPQTASVRELLLAILAGVKREWPVGVHASNVLSQVALGSHLPVTMGARVSYSTVDGLHVHLDPVAVAKLLATNAARKDIDIGKACSRVVLLVVLGNA